MSLQARLEPLVREDGAKVTTIVLSSEEVASLTGSPVSRDRVANILGVSTEVDGILKSITGGGVGQPVDGTQMLRDIGIKIK